VSVWAAAKPKRCGNDGAVENVENQTAVSHCFPPPLGNRQQRDFHIPTAPMTASPFFPTRQTNTTARTLRVLAAPNRYGMKGACCGTDATIILPRSGSSRIGTKLLAQAHAALESNADFRLISGLENAGL
jgi:hypothetical protein